MPAGTRVVERLLALGHIVHAVIAPHEFNNPALTAHLRALPHKDGQLLLFQGDVTQPGSCDAAVQAGATCLLHLAAVVRLVTDRKEQDLMMKVAMEGTRNVLGVCHHFITAAQLKKGCRCQLHELECSELTRLSSIASFALSGITCCVAALPCSESACKSNTLKRVVVSSSIAAVIAGNWVGDPYACQEPLQGGTALTACLCLIIPMPGHVVHQTSVQPSAMRQCTQAILLWAVLPAQERGLGHVFTEEDWAMDCRVGHNTYK